MLLHVLDGTSPDPVGDYKAIQLELELFNPALLDKPQVKTGEVSPVMEAVCKFADLHLSEEVSFQACGCIQDTLAQLQVHL